MEKGLTFKDYAFVQLWFWAKLFYVILSFGNCYKNYRGNWPNENSKFTWIGKKALEQRNENFLDLSNPPPFFFLITK